MKLAITCLSAGIIFATLTGMGADETLPMLKAGDNIYSNVTITSVTSTDVYFTYPGGIGNAKLKNLSPEMQKHFHFDVVKAGVEEKKQKEATAQFRQNILIAKTNSEQMLPAPTYEDGDLVVPKIFAKSFRGEVPPQIIVDHWLTPTPNPEGKFVLLVFWMTSAKQCRDAVPHLNDLVSKFKDRLVVIGLSNEPEEEMRRMKSPAVNFYVGTDTQSRTLSSFEITGVPHAVLIDPKHIVRFEGAPIYLQEKDLTHLLDAYAP